MKNGIKGYIAGILTCVLLLGVVFAANGQMREIFFGVQVSVNGEVQSFDDDMQPFIMDGRTFLPVRGIADALGLGVDFDLDTNTVLLDNPHFMEQLLSAFGPMLEPTFASMFEALGIDMDWAEIMNELADVDWHVIWDESMSEMMNVFAYIDWTEMFGAMLGNFDID